MEESKVIEQVFEKLAEILTTKELVKMAQLFLVRTLEQMSITEESNRKKEMEHLHKSMEGSNFLKERKKTTMLGNLINLARPEKGTLSVPLQQNLGGLFCRQQRTIRYVWADDHGRFDELGWATFEFCGRSLFNLRAKVAHRAGNKAISSGMTVCVRPGFYGRLTPLVIDLPRRTSSSSPLVTS